RFRVNIFQQRNSIGIVARVISDTVKNFAELGLPPILNTVSSEMRGLILVTGTTGSGKSTTLSAVVDHINDNRNCHIVTIEDPIEFLHKDKKSFITQREVDVDTRSFAEALRGTLRQDPDVILVGEMRDLETIETALVAAETGHLVLSTLHTLDAQETLTRIISAFPPFQQKSIRLQLSGLLKAVVSQRLMKSANGGGRVPAVEVLISTPLIRDYILHEEKTPSIRDAISAGTSQYGMQTFDQSLFYLYSSGLITLEEALHGSTNPDEFRLRLAGIQNTTAMAKEEMERHSGVGDLNNLLVRN
ncbi:MAG TPA: type IV pili twitching motility protein PilT, partial [Blastocatellia bacterium]|nr:type IV pili twitching motility protein PilT [Blastocatellia bacterium]